MTEIRLLFNYIHDTKEISYTWRAVKSDIKSKDSYYSSVLLFSMTLSNFSIFRSQEKITSESNHFNKSSVQLFSLLGSNEVRMKIYRKSDQIRIILITHPFNYIHHVDEIYNSRRPQKMKLEMYGSNYSSIQIFSSLRPKVLRWQISIKSHTK